ncbi:MAG TPA: LptF/LptG family permease [Gemmataceae bacterium]|nr:LptF/LptG family permease [Gemmataceae bacterium]
MYFGIINRMILAELVKVFLMSLVALTGMFLLAGLIQEASQKGLSAGQILMAIPLIIPNTLPFTIPATTLFATCVVYSRMSADNEVLVLRTTGVNIYHLLWPAMMLGVLTTAITAALYYDTIPRSQRLLREQLLKDAEGIIYGMLKREGALRQANLEFVLFVRDVQGRDLIDVVVKKRQRKDRTAYEVVARAQTARLRVRKVPVEADSSVPLLSDDATDEKGGSAGRKAGERPKSRGVSRGGERYELVVQMDRCYVDSLNGGSAADLQGQEYTTPLPEAIFGKDMKYRPSAQTWPELFKTREEFRDEIEDTRARIADMRAQPPSRSNSAGPQFGDADQEEEWLKFQYRNQRMVDTEIHMRPALAVGCLCFALVGCPVGIWASRSDYLSVFIVCFLPAVFAYYPMLLASLNLAKDGKVSPALAWAANGVVAVTALFLIKRLMKR